MKKLIRCEIRWDKKGECWIYRESGTVAFDNRHILDPPLTKRAFIKTMAGYLKRRIREGTYGFSLRIYNRNGRIAEERTYPRSADPRRSKG